MFGLGTQELLLILLIVVVLFGAAKIPELARSLGKGVSEFRKAQKEGREGMEKARPAGETEDTMTVCPSCRNEIAAGSPFCPKCGGRLRATKTCRACRNQAGSDDTLCPKCGEKL